MFHNFAHCVLIFVWLSCIFYCSLYSKYC